MFNPITLNHFFLLVFLFLVNTEIMAQNTVTTEGFLTTQRLASFTTTEEPTVADSKNTKVQYNLQQRIRKLVILQNNYSIADCAEECSLQTSIDTERKSIIADIKEQTGHTATARMMMPDIPCPEMQVIELLGIPGFAETDELVICGAPDTLAFLIFIEEPGNISGTQMSATFLPGMQYAGFELTHYGSGTISNLDPNPAAPKFLLEGITNGVYIGYIGIEATCDANVSAFEYEVDLDFTFIYEDTLGNFQRCRQSVTPIRTYNSVIKEPVLNFRSAPNTTINSLGTEVCTNIQLSQDGIDAYLSEVEFSICNVDFANEVTLNSLSANGTPIPYTYNVADSTVKVLVSGSFFEGNTLPNPMDVLFDESEILTMRVCMQVDECPTVNTQFITYKAAYYCHGDTCQVTRDDSEIRIRPTDRPIPIATSDLIQIPGVCGDPAIMEMTLQSSVADSAGGIFTDLIFGFETCDQSALDISKVTIGGTEIGPGNYAWIGDDLTIDLTTMTTDPDGSNNGITDADGDGFFDDLPGGRMITIRVELDFICALPPDPGSISCSSIDCSFAQFFVNAKRDCGQAFSYQPPVADFSITNGATYVELKNQDVISTSLTGYNFGTTRTTGANCSPIAPKVKTVEFCYIYERENIEPCPAASTTNELQVIFDGTPRLVYDVAFVPGSGQMTVNGVVTQTGVTGTFTDLSTSSRLMSLPIGELNVGDEVCYIYQLAADSASCSPRIYMNGTHQVIETCDTGGCTCTTVKACDVALFSSDPSNCSCTCDIASGANTRRWNLGYTDASMTEKVAIEDVPIEDQNRYLPCDTMYYEGWMTFNTPESVGELYQWYFVANITNIGSNGWGGNDDTELMIDAAGTELLGLDFSKQGGGGARAPIDISSFSECLDNPATGGATGFFAYAGKTPWSDVTYNIPMCNSSYEYHDGNLFGVYFRNFNKLEDCRGTETASWEEVDCLDQIKAAFNIEVGDTIYMKWLLPLTKNVKAAANEIADPSFIYRDPQMINVASGHFLDEFDSDCLIGLSNCRINSPFQTFCPEGINAVTEVELDDCGGQVEHIFNVVKPTPVNWFSAEYRPFFTMEDIEVPMYSPLIYCGNAKLVAKDGTEYPLNVQSLEDHTCATVDGQEYCTVSGADGIGLITFNPETDDYKGLGVGLGGYVDDFKIVYDLCKICPSDIPDFADYEITYDYRTCETLNDRCFRCNQAVAGTSNELPRICGTNGSALVDRLGYYYDELNLDTLFRWDDVTSGDVITTDVSNGFPALTQVQDRNLLSSTSPGISEELNTITVCADGADPNLETHTGVLSSITLTNSVAFIGAYDAAMNPLVFDTVSVGATTTTYAVFLPDLAPGECTEFKIGTQLLFCPTPPEKPEICITTTSGCMPRDIMAALVGETSACNSIETCYQYVFEESGIQADFLTPEAGASYALCDTILMAVLVKNVKTTTLTNITLDIDLPLVGMMIIPGSFEASYPNSGNFSLPFYSIVDPAINGNNLLYTEDNDFSNAIHSDGLPGVTSMADSNFVVVRFLVETKCDEFVSGSQAKVESTATDPCSPDILSSGIVTSNKIIINGANPADYGQVLITAKPSEAFCGQDTPTFKITGQNISEQPLGDSVSMCVTLPAGLTYQTGSMRYVIPTFLNVGTEIVTTVNGQTQICFQGYENMPIGGAFTLNFEADFEEDAACGDYEIQVDTKNLIEDESCTDGGLCDVFVQSSVNPTFNLTLKGPLETVDLKLFRQCTGSEDPVTVCYEVVLSNPSSQDYNGDITVNLHDDLLADQVLDFYDPLLGNEVFTNQFVAAGESITLMGCYEVDEINSCPVILDMVYDSPCTCNHLATPFSTIEPEFTAALPPTTVLCPGQELGMQLCGDYDITYDPASNVVTRTVGDSLYLSVIDQSIVTRIDFSGTAGECTVDEVRFIRGVEEFDIELGDSLVCQNQDVILELSIPIEYQDFITIQWSPATNLDDPTIINPLFNASVPGIYKYEIALEFNGGCIQTDSVEIEVKPVGMISITGDPMICAPYETNTLSANAGYDYYEWYLLDGGFEIIKASTPTETWTGATEPGKYIVKGFRSTDLCPGASDTLMIMQDECIDLELTKNVLNVPDPLHIGNSVTYEIVVCNIMDPNLAIGYDAFDVQIADQLPAGVSYISHTQTTGSYSPTQNEWDISILENGTCDTLWIDVTIEEYGCIINTAQITDADKEDIDSTPNNDDGDQSEDEEDSAKIIVDTFDLALTKKLSPTQTAPVTIGSTVTYDIEVCNQGNIDAYDVQVVDYVPTGMMVIDPNWTLGSVADEYFYTIPGPITAGNCTTIQLVTEVTVIPTSGSYINYAEINTAKDSNGNTPPDIDSTPDNDPGNDGPVEDDKTDNSNGDEDDHDPAEILVITVACQISTNGPVCPETALMLEEIGMNNVKWTWSGLSGFTAMTKAVTIDPPVAGIYSVIVTDINGLTSTCEIATSIHPAMELTTVQTNLSCFEAEDGTIDLTITGGTGPFTFDWSNDGPDAPADDTEDLSNLAAGTYDVVVTDANGCSKETSVNLTQPIELECTLTGTNLFCNGDNSGTIDVQATGGTLPYEYSLDGAAYQSSTSFTGIAAGIHTLTVRDANGCISTCELALTEPELLACSIKPTDDSSCIIDNGAVETMPTGGTAPYEYRIDGGGFQSSPLFSGLGAGTYTLTVKDANDCIATCEVTLSSPSRPACTIASTTNITCKSGMDGSLVAEGSLGSGNYEFSLDGTIWQTTGTFTDLAAGTHTVTIRNSDFPTCTSICTTTLTEPEPLSCSLTGTPISCNGDSDGTITAVAIGGLGNYEYSIDGGMSWQFSNLFTGLPIGDYTVELRDNGDIDCFASCEISLTEPPVLTCTLTPTDIACNGGNTGSIQVNATGGITPLEFSLNGGAWQSGNVFNNLIAGSYTVTASDQNDCLSTCTVTITEPTPFICTTTKTDVTNCEAADGTITAMGVGGIPPYLFSLDNSSYQTNNNFTGLVPGSYRLYIKDTNGCVGRCEEVVINTPMSPICAIESVVDVACNGDATGSVIVSGNAGTPPYEFSIDNSIWQASGTFSDLTAGAYMVYIRNTSSINCVSVCAFEIQEPTPLECFVVGEDVSCKDGNDGTATVTASGGVTDYTYIWDDANAQTTATATGLVAGTYRVTVTDANNCSKICGVILTEPPVLACTLTATEIACNGDSDAQITVTTTGGIAPYEHSLDGVSYQPGNICANLTAGTYTIFVKDANNCIATCSITITEPSALSCSTTKTDLTDCMVTDGTITVTATGGIMPYTYLVDGGAPQSSNEFTGLDAGSHLIQVEDANGCITTCVAIIIAPTTPVCDVIFTKNISCTGGDDGVFSVEASGGSGIYEYSLNGAAFQNASTFDNLVAGNYTIVVRNVGQSMCTFTCYATLTEPTPLTCSTINFDVSCIGGNDGQAMITAQGGTTGYTYLWSNGSTTNTANDLTAGSYNVTTTDAQGCQKICSVTISEPPVLAFTTTITQVACNGDASGIIIVSPTGGTSPYEYSLNSMAWQPGNIYAGLTAGNHVITVRDAQGCFLSALITITEPSALSCTLVTTNATNCEVHDGTITVNAVGGVPAYEYSRDGVNYQTSNTFNNLMAGSYILSVKDVNGCISTCSTTITTPEAPYCQVSAITPVKCFGEATGSFTVIGTEGNPPYEFSIDSTNWLPIGVFNNLIAGQYTIYIRNAGSTNCISMCAVKIEQPTELTCQLLPIDPLCKNGTDGSITVLATQGTPGYQYRLDGSPWQFSPVFSGLTAGDYSVTIRDANDCMTTCTVTLGEPPLLTCSTTVVDLLCNGDGDGIITVTGAGGTGAYEYKMNGGAWQTSNIFAGLNGGDYVLSIRDEQNCISTCTASVHEPTPLVCHLVNIVPESCAFNDGSIEVVASGGTGTPTYSIDGGATTQTTGLFSGLTLGTYTITIQDENNCVTTCSFEILPDCYDLALVKKLITPGPYSYGQKVVFDIEVINQGNIHAVDVTITDYIPCGFTYNPSASINIANNWTAANTTVPMSTIASLPTQTRNTIQIELIVTECTDTHGHTNVAEISEAFDDTGNLGQDVDSTPDNDPTDDAGGDPNGPSDNQENGVGTDDEDDHDPALVQVYDLALTKKLLTPEPYDYGDIIEFVIEVCNQASNPVGNITISDYVPIGYSFDASLNPVWTGNSPTPTTLNYTYTGPLLYGTDCIQIPLFLRLEMVGGTDDWKNVGEISDFEDENGDSQKDVDSTPDDNSNNDGAMENNITDGTNGDEDDSDPAGPEIVDIALVKTTMDTGPFVYGDTITFDIEIFNQGSIDLYNIVVNDFIPCGYRFLGGNVPLWNFTSSPSAASTIIAGPIVPGGSTTVSIQLAIIPCPVNSAEAWTNIAEVESFEGEDGVDRTNDDIDSNGDNDPTNDNTDDNVNDNSNGDEDDNDLEVIDIFDLALIKKLAPNQAVPVFLGDVVSFEITIFNQGNLAAYDIDVADYVPNGLLFNASLNTASATGNIHDWILNGATPTYTINSLHPTEMRVLTINLIVDEGFLGGTIINYGEITHAADTPGAPNRRDIDSTADAVEDNDAGGESGGLTDNQTNGHGINDEDDHDPAEIYVIAHYARIVDPCTCLGNGLLSDKITIYSSEEEGWVLTQNIGMYSPASTSGNLIPIQLGTQATYVGIENGLYKFEMILVHVDGIGYDAVFNNGITPPLEISNLCSCPLTNDDPEATPGEVIPTLLFNTSKTQAESTVERCEGTTFTNSIAEHTLYNDEEACRIAHTICPQTQWQKITYTLDRFDLAAGDTLCVFQGKDTTDVPVARWSGAGVSQTGGWISSDCSPADNEEGCLTFLFKTNGDRNKGTGFSGKLTCEDRGIEINAAIKNGKVGCNNPLDWIEFPAPTITAACDPTNNLGDAMVSLLVKNQAGELCMDTITQLLSAYPDTLDLAIGIYTAEYFLTADSVKTTGPMVFNVTGPSLVCNDEVNVSINSGCGIELSPDDLLENPCDPTAWMNYHFTVVLGTGKDTVQVQGSSALLTGSGAGSASTPIVWISKEDFKRAGLDGCSGTAEVTIEKVFYENGVPRGPDCDNGIQKEVCKTLVNFSDNTAPIIQLESVADTLVSCDTIGLASLLEATTIDNCDEDANLTYSISLEESDPCLSGAGSPDTTHITVNYTATDACGNVGKAEKRIVMLRPTTFVVPATTIASCSEEDIEAELPGVEIGYKTATEFVITDTLALDTTDYVCGYLLSNIEETIPANECGRKQYINWSVLDWCDSDAGNQFIGTQLINYQDTLAPAFVVDSLAVSTIAFAADDCSYDATSIVAPIATDNCSEPSVRIDSIFRIEEGSLWVVAQSDWTSLDADSFSIRWVATDICHEQLVNDTLSQTIVLEDKTAPYAICTDGLNVSLGMDSTRVHYSDIDGGSSDACGITTYEVSTDQENWSEHVSVNCADLQEGLTVHLRVTDAAGNAATCLMEILPEDKLAPICTDLATINTTCSEGHAGQYGVSTDTDEDGEMEDSEWINLTGDLEAYYNETFGHPSCSDNLTCQEITIEQQYQVVTSTCGRIEIARRYRARDWSGEGMVSGWATQTINVTYKADWSLTLPVDWVGACGEEIPTANLAITNGTCDAIAFEIDEQVFTAAEDACMKVIRTYRIINWCKYQVDQAAVQIVREEMEGVVSSEQQITAQDTINGIALADVGVLEYIQVLKLQDDEAPRVIMNPVSTCLEECSETRFFSANAFDCNLASSSLVRFSWELFENGIAQSSGTGDGFEWEVGANSYRVIWTARDACGNVTKAEETYNFEDCKQPTAYCLHGVAIELMPTGMVEIWASDLDVNSEDQCPDNEVTLFLWHSNLGIAQPSTTAEVAALADNLIFTCNDLGSQEVALYVMDAAGNYDYCTGYVNVQDNNNACPASVEESQVALVSGQVMSWKGDAVEQVMLSATNTNYETQVDGVYHLQLPMYIDYTITPEKDMNPLNGVSTFDLVLITKHILGIKPFESPYQWIAADVNRSRTVTAFDMVQLRRLILAIDDNFKQNTSWRFVESDYLFENINPLEEAFPEVGDIANLNGDMAMDFTAVKIGDVNGNAKPNSLYEAEVRTSPAVLELQVAAQYLKAGNTYEVVFTTEQLAQVQGYQFTLNFTDLRVDKVQGSLMQLENFGLQGMDKGWITASWNNTVAGRRSTVDGASTPLFTLHFLALADGNLSDLLHLGARPTVVEAYNQAGEIMDIELTFTEAITGSEFELFQNEPNPFQEQTSIGYVLPADSDIELILRDEAGRVLRVIRAVGKAGLNQIQLNKIDLPAGFIYYQLNTKYGTKSKKMLRIE